MTARSRWFQSSCRYSIRVILAIVVAVLFTIPAFGTSQRTFVSRTGLDANTCAIDQPCRSFGAAILQTNPNGEIVVVDSAGYGAVIINKAVGIIAPQGVHAGISVFSGDGVTINAAASDVVVLRNLYINSQGGVNGITLNSASAVHVEHCVVSGFSANNINLRPTSNAQVAVSDTVVRQGGTTGIYADSAAHLTVSVAGCHLQNNGSGLVADRASIAVRDSDSNGNLGVGFRAEGTGGAAQMTIQASVASNNSWGVEVDNGVVAVLGSTMSNNGSGGLFSFDSKLTIEGCSVVGNFGEGVLANNSRVSVANSTISDTPIGIEVINASIVELVHNTITRNNTGIVNAAAIHSSGDNVVDDNFPANYEILGSGVISAANKM